MSVFVGWCDPTGQKPRTRPALLTAEEVVSDGGWHRWDEVVTQMVATSDVLPKSASNCLHDLVQAGILQRRGKHPDRQVRLAPVLQSKASEEA